MGRGLNKVMLIGYLGGDPEMRFTASGRAVATFSLAVSRGWTNNEGERQEETEWFHIVAWGRLAELCKKRLHKGSRVYVEGRIQTRSWETPEGNRHYRTEVVAQEMVFLDTYHHDAPVNIDAGGTCDRAYTAYEEEGEEQ